MDELKNVVLLCVLVTFTLISNVICGKGGGGGGDGSTGLGMKVQPVYLNYESITNFWGPGVDPIRAHFATPSNSIAANKIELKISITNLPAYDATSKPNPMCTTSVRWFNNNVAEEVHKTEVIQNNANPTFAKMPLVPYTFEQKQIVVFKIFDGNSTKMPTRDPFLGFAECSLGALVTLGTLRIPLRKTNAYSQGEVIVKVERVIADREHAHIGLSGWNIKSPYIVSGFPEPFVEIYKRNKSDLYELVYKTEVAHSTTTPMWQPFHLPLKTLCEGDRDRILKFICWDWDKRGRRELLGEFEATVNELSRTTNKTFPLTNIRLMNQMAGIPNQMGGIPNQMGGVHSQVGGVQNQIGGAQTGGQINIPHFNIIQVPSFIEYIRGGLRIHCTVAIDFTNSNGNQYDMDSLHFKDPTGTAMNKYELGLSSVLSILEDYDSDKLFPAYGLGARHPRGGQVQPIFNLNPTSQCVGAQGVLDAYNRILPDIEFASPMSLAPLIRNFMQAAASSGNLQDNYFILYILTNGTISDIYETEQAVNEASRLPISIIIAGIGDKQFENMEQLDADHIPKDQAGIWTRRDIVQFVPLKKYKGSGTQDPTLMLAKEALSEVTSQIVTYMQFNNFMPKAPVFTNPVSPYGMPYMNVQQGLNNVPMYQGNNAYPGGFPPNPQFSGQVAGYGIGSSGQVPPNMSMMQGTPVYPSSMPTGFSSGPYGPASGQVYSTQAPFGQMNPPQPPYGGQYAGPQGPIYNPPFGGQSYNAVPPQSSAHFGSAPPNTFVPQPQGPNYGPVGNQFNTTPPYQQQGYNTQSASVYHSGNTSSVVPNNSVQHVH